MGLTPKTQGPRPQAHGLRGARGSGASKRRRGDYLKNLWLKGYTKKGMHMAKTFLFIRPAEHQTESAAQSRLWR